MARVSRRRRRFANVLILAGLAGIGIWVWSLVRTASFQNQANRAFEEENRAAPQGQPPAASAPRPAPPKPGEVIGRLVIPRLHLRAIVREGADAHTLDVALGHVPGTALPGTDGNVGIAGHRDTLFRCLRNISRDDRIILETSRGTYDYAVDKTSIVTPKDVDVLAPGTQPEITLVTCYPFYYVGPAPNRFIVQARLLTPEASAGQPAPPPPAAPAHRKLVTRASRRTPGAPGFSPYWRRHGDSFAR